MYDAPKSVILEWCKWSIAFMVILVSGCAGSSASGPLHTKQETPYRNLHTLPDGTILHVPTGVEMSRTQLLDYLSNARIIYVGEVHTNLNHHQAQLDIIEGLVQRFSGGVAVGMEMFSGPSQPELDQWSQGELDEKSFIKVWYSNWDQDYNYYQDILRFIRDQKIPLIALNASHEQVRLMSEKGLEGFPETARQDIPEFDLADTYHRNSMKAVFRGHAHGDQGFDRFYQTMLLWDETMAQRTVDYLSSPEGQGMKMIVLAGGFHIRYGFGIPRRVFRRLPVPYFTVLPYTSRIPEGKEYLIMDVIPQDLPLYISDFIWTLGYKDLEERQIRLGVQIESSGTGILVRAVDPDSSADKAGVKAGDIVTAFGGEPVMEPFDLIFLIRQLQVGDGKTLRLLRGKEELELEVLF